MKTFCSLLFSSLSISFLIAPIAVAQNVSAEEKAYVGGYTQGSVDSLTRLALLDDNTFCFSVTAGSLDLLAAGHWKANTKDTGISLHEVRVDKPLFPALIKMEKKQGDLVVFNFDGYSLSNAESAVFAVSATDVQPASFRPLFSPENTSWDTRYKLPPIKAEKARYFFIGYGESEYHQLLRVKVVQYKLRDGNTVLVGFDQVQATPLMNMSAKLVNDVLYVDGEKYGKKTSLSPEVMQQARENCVYPAMQPNKVRPKNKCVKTPGSDCEEEDEPENSRDQMLVPIKTFNVDLKAIKGEPWIDRKKVNADSTLRQ